MNDDALQLLLGDRHILWRNDTRHEAMLLLREVYSLSLESTRNRILKYILAGPPAVISAGLTSEKRDYLVFELLEYLTKVTDIPLSDQANTRHVSLKTKGFKIDLEHAGMRSYMVVGDRSYMADGNVQPLVAQPVHIEKTAPEAVLDQILTYQDDFDSTQADVCEQAGIAIVDHPEWGFPVLEAIHARINEVPAELMGAILWGIHRRAKEAAEFDTGRLLNCWHAMVTSRPEPGMWSSLPNVMEQLVVERDLDVGPWNGLARHLGELFLHFDYERKEGDSKVRWAERAGNHPLGRLVRTYLDVAQREISRQGQASENYHLPRPSRDFFELVLSQYGTGSRYGLCLLAERLSWLHAIDHEWTEDHLLPSQTAPTQIEQVGLFPTKLAEMVLQDSERGSLARLLVAFIKADVYPSGHQDEWAQLCNKLSNTDPAVVDQLKNELARKGLEGLLD